MVSGFMAGAAGGAAVNIVINAVDRFSKTFARASTSSSRLKGAFKGAAVGIAAAGAVIAGVGIKAVNTAKDFETAFTGVRKTVDLTEEQFQELDKRFKDITKTTPIAYEELAGIGEIAGQLGVEGVDNIEKFTKTVADISVTTNLTSERAATDFARIANVMNEPLENVDRMGSTVVDLGNNFAVSEAEISKFSQRIASSASVVGMTTDEVMGISAAFGAVAVPAERGGTAFQKTILTINDAVNQGGEQLEKFAATAGMSSSQFAELFEKDAAQAFNKFVDGVGSQGKAGATTLEELQLGSVRVKQSIMALGGAEGQLTKALETSNKAWDKNNALSEEAEKRYDTFASQIQVLKNNFKIMFEELGKKIIPVLVDVMKVITKDVIPALEPLLDIIGKEFTKMVKRLVPFIKPLVGILTKMFEIFGRLMDAIWPLIEPLMEVAFVIADALMEALKALMPAIEALIPLVLEIFNAFKPLIKPLTDILVLLAKLASDVIIGMVVPVLKFLMPIIKFVAKILIFLVNVIKTVIEWFNQGGKEVNLFGKVLMFLVKISSKVTVALMKAWWWVRDQFTLLWNGIKNVVITVWNGIVQFIENAVNKVIGFVNQIIEKLNKVPGVSIPLIPEVDLGKFKKEVTKMSDLKARLKEEREQRGKEMEQQMNFVVDKLNEKIIDKFGKKDKEEARISQEEKEKNAALLSEQLKGMSFQSTVEIDGEEIARSQGDLVKEKINV